MSTIVSRLDVTQIFCDVGDFCSSWESMWQKIPHLPSMTGERRRSSKMCLSEVIVIVIAFHGSGDRTFKEFYMASGFSKPSQLHVIGGVNALVFNVVMLFFT